MRKRGEGMRMEGGGRGEEEGRERREEEEEEEHQELGRALDKLHTGYGYRLTPGV